MAKLLILLLAGFLGFSLWNHFKRLPPPQRRDFLFKYAGILLLGIAILLVVTGRLHWIGAALAALVPIARHAPSLLMRWWPVLRWVRQKKFANSVVRTRFLNVTVDQQSGAMNGTITEGDYQGQALEDLSEAQLQELLVTYRKLDPESSRLLSAYMQRRFQGTGYQQQSQPAENSSLSRAEALQILGLDDEATREDIVKAHKSLMQKVHPDRGGSDYLAAKINQAKDFLLRT